MIKCRKCGYEGIFEKRKCPVCGAAMTLDKDGIEALRREAIAAREAGEEEALADSWQTLALAGDTEGEREYAKLLERGIHFPRDIDLAMEYFHRAARKLDPYSAYRYSRLISRMNDEISSFWLLFSAVLSNTDAYKEAADVWVHAGFDGVANYYYSLAEAAGDADARVQLASRYLYGEGVECSEPFAKWYMERFTFPPISALRLSYKLRGVTAAEPPELIPDRKKLLSHLIGRARRLGVAEAQIHLYRLLADEGDDDALYTLAGIYLDGRLTPKDPEEAVRILENAAADGNAAAFIALGILYADGRSVPLDLERALGMFERAVRLGRSDAYEFIADIYHREDYEERDVALAYELYKKAEADGSDSAKEKAQRIRTSRESFYLRAMRDPSPTEAFKYYFVSSAMGHPLATVRLAECYALGRGTPKDRREAYRLYKKAHDEGTPEAQLPLGVCYSRGIGTRQSFALARHHLTRAKLNGNEKAAAELARMSAAKRRRLTDRCFSRAMRLIYMGKYTASKVYLDAAHKLRHPRAIYTLGALYEFGRGTATNRTRAYELYLEAESLGFSDPRSAYKSILLKFMKR